MTPPIDPALDRIRVLYHELQRLPSTERPKASHRGGPVYDAIVQEIRALVDARPHVETEWAIAGTVGGKASRRDAVRQAA